jgi:Domain of unknown function (DUF1771)/Smr domain
VNKLYDEAGKCSAQSQAAYQRGDGALAKQLSEKAKDFRKQAAGCEAKKSEFVFQQNNQSTLVKDDEIDLHGQRVDEIIPILDQELKERCEEGMTYVHIIVGKGNHSKDGIPKIKPAVEELCNQRGYQWRLEQNEGRIYIELPRPVRQEQTPPPEPGYGYDGQQQQPPGGYPGYAGQQQAVGGYQQYPQQGNVQPQRREEESLCPCCVVM